MQPGSLSACWAGKASGDSYSASRSWRWAGYCFVTGLNTAGWHATAAGGILLAMTVGLDAMRKLEEQQKMEKTSCEK